MNILFLNTGVPNYGPDSIYIGLKRLGHIVEDRPRKKSLHSNSCLYHFGMEVCGDFGTSVVNNPDLVFVETSYKGSLPKSFIVVDGSDRNSREDRLYQSAFLYFKREYTKEWKKFPKAKPLQFGLVKKQDSFGILSSKRDIDVSFTLFPHGRSTAFIRKKVLVFLENMKGFKVALGFKSFSEYQKILDASKISISLRGRGWDTYRYWEIVHHGAILCSECLPIEIPNNFGDEAIFFDSSNPADLEDKLKYYLSNPDQLDRMQAKAWERLVKFHTAKARAKYILQEVNRYHETL